MTTRRQNRVLNKYGETDRPRQGFFGLMGMLVLEPRSFFRLLDGVSLKYSLWTAILILSLLSFSAVQQAALSSADSSEMLPFGEDLSFDEEFSSVPVADPSQSWMTALTAAGTQIVYWLIMALVLSEVSLFKGKAPQFGRNFKIAIWASLPIGMMALVQVLFLLGGGSIGEAGFTGFLDEWQSYGMLNPYLQSLLFAMASQMNLFALWSGGLLYLGARESLEGKRLTIGLALGMWLCLLLVGLSFQAYQKMNPSYLDEGSFADYPPDEMPTEESFPVSAPIDGEF